MSRTVVKYFKFPQAGLFKPQIREGRSFAYLTVDYVKARDYALRKVIQAECFGVGWKTGRFVKGE